MKQVFKIKGFSGIIEFENREVKRWEKSAYFKQLLHIRINMDKNLNILHMFKSFFLFIILCIPFFNHFQIVYFPIKTSYGNAFISFAHLNQRKTIIKQAIKYDWKLNGF